MSIRDLVLAVRRHRLVFVAGVLATVAMGAYLAASAPRTYTAHTQLFVSTTDADSVDALVQTRVPSYAALAGSPLVGAAVVSRLGLRQSPEAVAARVDATSPLDLAVIDVTVHDSTPQGAVNLATAIGQVLGGVISTIEGPTAGPGPIKITVVSPPVLPQQPTGTGTLPGLALALFLGLLAGTAAAVVRDRTDPRLREAEELRTTFALRPLSTIPVDASARRWPPTAAGSWPSTAEGFRGLRTNLQVLLSDRDVRSVLVTGTGAGGGSSAVVRDLALVLDLARVRVLLVEANLRDGTMARQWGVDGSTGLATVLSGETDAANAIKPSPSGSVHVLPGGPPPTNPSELLGSPMMSELIATWEREYDLVLFDAPDVLGVTDAAVLARRTGGTLVSVWQGRTRRDDIRRALATLRDVDARVLGAVVLTGTSRRAQRWRGLQVALPDPLEPPPTASDSPAGPTPVTGGRPFGHQPADRGGPTGAVPRQRQTPADRPDVPAARKNAEEGAARKNAEEGAVKTAVAGQPAGNQNAVPIVRKQAGGPGA